MQRYKSFADLAEAARKAPPPAPRRVAVLPPPPPPPKPLPEPPPPRGHSAPAVPLDVRDLKRGMICLAHCHFSDASQSKIRPVLILSGCEGGPAGDVICVAITGTTDRGIHQTTVYLDPADHDFEQTGLDYASAIKCAKPLTLACYRVIGQIGTLPQRRIHEVQVILARRLGLVAAPVDNVACECHADAVLHGAKAG